MLYELIAVVRQGSLAEVKEIAKTAGSLVLSNGGVVRGITNWGILALPKKVRKYQMTHHCGHYFLMRFDAGVEAQKTVRNTLGLDPRLIRFSIVKMGHKLDDIADVPGRAWTFNKDYNVP